VWTAAGCEHRSHCYSWLALEAGFSIPYDQIMEQWRQLIGHDGYFVVRLRLLTPEEGGRGRAIQSGYHPQWWISGSEVRLGSGPLDVIDELSIRPGQTGSVRVYPMGPAQWKNVQPGMVIDLRERQHKTLGTGEVLERLEVPDDAPLRLDAVPHRGKLLRRKM
jgi:hypothetical protein